MSDRPLECSECKKPVKVVYTEIIGGTMTRTDMCEDCPALKRRIQGVETGDSSRDTAEPLLGLCCGECGSNLESVPNGHPLGCQECYEVFADAILAELRSTDKVFIGSSKDTTPSVVHMGRAPGETGHISPSARLLALNEALSETLNKEDYEQQRGYETRSRH